MASTTIWRKNVIRLLALVAASALAAVFGFTCGASAANKLKTLYAFCKKLDCSDGRTPLFPPVQDSTGALYSTTFAGGSNDSGVAFALVPKGMALEYQVLYRFCTKANCTDGAHPGSPLIVDTDGNLYGTTIAGGAFNGGTAFELIPNADRSEWQHVVLYNFCSQSNCTDGSSPTFQLTYQGAEGGSLYDGTSPLYGATVYGGTGSDVGGDGVVFQLTAKKGKTKRKEQVLYSFCTQTACSDGGDPSGLIIDASGNLYGAAGLGGANGGSGAVFEIDPTTKAETVLYSFCQLANCLDGQIPTTALTMDTNGRLYGTTERGGAGGLGVVFRIVLNGIDSIETVLHSFCLQPNCTDGEGPQFGVALDSNGDLFGTTPFGGAFSGSKCEGHDGCGTVFKLHNTNYTVLHSFCEVGLPDCPDGAEPAGGSLFLDGSGNVFGTAATGGKQGSGTVFELTP